MTSVAHRNAAGHLRMSLSESPGASSPAVVSSPSAAPPSPPRRQTISSASEMPQTNIKAAVFSQHVATYQYVDHYRKSMEALRHQHREERAMWEVERQELLLKVAELEAKITRISNIQSLEVPSIADKLSKYSIGSAFNSRSASAPSNTVSGTFSREQLLSSYSPTQFNSFHQEKGASRQHMDSIPEALERTKSVSFATAEEQSNEQLNKELEGQVVPGELVDKDLDGVMIKATSLPPAVKKAILRDSATPSPLRSPSPSKETPPENATETSQKPVTIEIAATQKVLQLPSRELYTHAAGHTPLARVTDSSEEASGGITPVGDGVIQHAEQEKPPLEPYPSTQDVKPIRPPNERGDSYFNVPVPQPTEPKAVVEPFPPTNSGKAAPAAESNGRTENIPDDDPPLKGPLSMPHEPTHDFGNEGNDDFLSKLDKRLNHLSKEQDSAQEDHSTENHISNRDNGDPPLRIKRSLNFGSAWGAGNAGRNA